MLSKVLLCELTLNEEIAWPVTDLFLEKKNIRTKCYASSHFQRLFDHFYSFWILHFIPLLLVLFHILFFSFETIVQQSALQRRMLVRKQIAFKLERRNQKLSEFEKPRRSFVPLWRTQICIMKAIVVYPFNAINWLRTSQKLLRTRWKEVLVIQA